MEPFVYTGQPGRVVFGSGASAGLKDEVAALGGARALFCCSPGRGAEVERFAAASGTPTAGLAAIAMPFTPAGSVAEGRRIARELEADCLVSYGGGNAVGLAKGIALELDIPIIAIATTYSGSETTALQGIRDGGKRVNHRSPRMLPKTIIYDPALTVGLPLAVSVPSGVNSMAHAVAALIAGDGNPLTGLLAAEGLRAMAAALVRIADDPADLDARGEALYGAWLSGSTLMATGMVLHHKVCHVLAGDFGLSAAQTHTIVLPHATAYNRDARPGAMRRIARALGDEDIDAAGAIFDLLERCAAPTALRAIGMPEDGLDRAAGLILTDPYDNPRPYEADAIRALLDDAWHGRRPTR